MWDTAQGKAHDKIFSPFQFRELKKRRVKHCFHNRGLIIVLIKYARRCYLSPRHSYLNSFRTDVAPCKRVDMVTHSVTQLRTYASGTSDTAYTCDMAKSTTELRRRFQSNRWFSDVELRCEGENRLPFRSALHFGQWPGENNITQQKWILKHLTFLRTVFSSHRLAHKQISQFAVPKDFLISIEIERMSGIHNSWALSAPLHCLWH